MIPVLLFLCLACPGVPGDHAFVEMEVSGETFFVQETVTLKLRVVLDASFFESQAIQLFPTRLDLPIHVEAAVFDALPGVIPLEEEPSPPSGQGVSFALNDGVTKGMKKGEREVGGKKFMVIEKEISFLPVRPGEITIPRPCLRFAYATRFDDDLISGRVPADRNDVVVEGEALGLFIMKLPESGRPSDFSGAVGRFAVAADVNQQALFPGESFKLRFRVKGRGNLAIIDVPEPGPIEGFYTYGRLFTREPGLCTVTLDLTPLSDTVRELPAIPFTFFDPGPPPQYRRILTDPIPLEVKPLPRDARLPLLAHHSDPVPGENDLFGWKPSADLHGRDNIPSFLVWAGLGLPWIVGLGLFFWLRARDRAAADPLGMRARRAAEVFRSALIRKRVDPGQAFLVYLSDRLGCTPWALVDPEVETRLAKAGLPDDLAARAKALLTALTEATYGGSPAKGDKTITTALVNDLERAFDRLESAP